MWKKIAGGFLLVIGLVTSGFVIEDRYNNQNHHDKDIKTERSLTNKDLEKLETAVVMNLKQMNTEQSAQRKQTDTRYYLDQLDYFNRQIRDAERRLRSNRNDQNARDDFNYYTNEKNKVRQKLEALTR
jgi:hypothetical protein